MRRNVTGKNIKNSSKPVTEFANNEMTEIKKIFAKNDFLISLSLAFSVEHKVHQKPQRGRTLR